MKIKKYLKIQQESALKQFQNMALDLARETNNPNMKVMFIEEMVSATKVLLEDVLGKYPDVCNEWTGSIKTELYGIIPYLATKTEDSILNEKRKQYYKETLLGTRPDVEIITKNLCTKEEKIGCALVLAIIFQGRHLEKICLNDVNYLYEYNQEKNIMQFGARIAGIFSCLTKRGKDYALARDLQSKNIPDDTIYKLIHKEHMIEFAKKSEKLEAIRDYNAFIEKQGLEQYAKKKEIDTLDNVVEKVKDKEKAGILIKTKQIDRMIKSGGNFAFIAQNMATIYYVVKYCLDECKSLTESQLLYATALFDVVAYINEGELDYADIRRAMEKAQNGTIGVNLNTRHIGNKGYPHEQLLNLTMQIETIIFRVSTPNIEEQQIIRLVIQNKSIISATIEETLKEGMNAPLFKDVSYNVKKFAECQEYFDSIRKYE